MLSELVNVKAVGLVVSLGCFHVIGFLDFLVFYCFYEKTVLFELKVLLEFGLAVVEASGDLFEFVLDVLGYSLGLTPYFCNGLIYYVLIQWHIISVLLDTFFSLSFHEFHQTTAFQVL